MTQMEWKPSTRKMPDGTYSCRIDRLINKDGMRFEIRFRRPKHCHRTLRAAQKCAKAQINILRKTLTTNINKAKTSIDTKAARKTMVIGGAWW